jgi:hypothetical protein
VLVNSKTKQKREDRLKNFQFVSEFFKFVLYRQISRTIIHIIFIVCLFDCPVVHSAFEKKDVGATSFALGNAVVALENNMFAIYYNPAALINSEHTRFALTAQNFYGISDLNAFDFTTCFPLADHPFSIALNGFGDQKYHEFQFSIGSSFEIIENGSVGMSIQYYMLTIEGYGQTMVWGINLGIMYKFLPGLTIGSMVTNLNRPSISVSKERLPQTMSLGFSYFPVYDLMLAFDIFQDSRFEPEFRAGFSYQVMSALTIRAGVEDQLNTYCYGLGIHVGQIFVNYALRTHSVLGISHVATLLITL